MEYERETLRRLQLAELGILQAIDEACAKLGIPYFLDGGTALGAVRHGGFIPWDDDADIGMLRPDYERFLVEAPALLGSRFTVASPRTHPAMAGMFAKVMLAGTGLRNGRDAGGGLRPGGVRGRVSLRPRCARCCGSCAPAPPLPQVAELVLPVSFGPYHRAPRRCAGDMRARCVPRSPRRRARLDAARGHRGPVRRGCHGLRRTAGDVFAGGARLPRCRRGSAPLGHLRLCGHLVSAGRARASRSYGLRRRRAAGPRAPGGLPEPAVRPRLARASPRRPAPQPRARSAWSSEGRFEDSLCAMQAHGSCRCCF